MPQRYELLLGDEAVAWGAIDAGVAGAFGYAGTPSTEIFESIQIFAPFLDARWSANEKVALEEALGMSYAGKRALVTMKHVGLNVAADPLMSSALTGVNGGLVLAVADDPGMHSSQNEQDSRFYAEFARVPCFEPSTHQECYDMVREAFRVSERFQTPVLLRLVTRLAHSRSTVVLPEENERERRQVLLDLPNPNDWTLVPANARRRNRRLLDLQAQFLAYAEESPFNRLHLAGKRGVLCTSTAHNYVREAIGDDPADSLLRVAVYPLPGNLIRKLVDHCDEIVVLEEGYPFIESRLCGLYGVPGKQIRGKLEGSLPLDGELLPDTVLRALGMQSDEGMPADSLVAGRPPQFCKGCPHSSTFNAIIDATAGFDHPLMFGDIGCYTLGIMPPFSAVHSCVDMGASIGMAMGAARAGRHPVLCTIGDSTFAHSGMTGLLGAVHENANITVMILDNATTAMTGAQDSMATGEGLLEIIRGLGVKHVLDFDPLPKHHAANVAAIKEGIAHEGLSVVVARRACVRLKPAKIEAASAAAGGQE